MFIQVPLRKCRLTVSRKSFFTSHCSGESLFPFLVDCFDNFRLLVVFIVSTSSTPFNKHRPYSVHPFKSHRTKLPRSSWASPIPAEDVPEIKLATTEVPIVIHHIGRNVEPVKERYMTYRLPYWPFERIQMKYEPVTSTIKPKTVKPKTYRLAYWPFTRLQYI